MDYAKALRIGRAARGIAQKDLANRADLDPSYVSLLESGGRIPSARALGLLAKALAIPVPVLALLAAEQEDLTRNSPQHMEAIGKLLVDVLVKATPR